LLTWGVTNFKAKPGVKTTLTAGACIDSSFSNPFSRLLRSRRDKLWLQFWCPKPYKQHLSRIGISESPFNLKMYRWIYLHHWYKWILKINIFWTYTIITNDCSSTFVSKGSNEVADISSAHTLILKINVFTDMRQIFFIKQVLYRIICMYF
jgi:hypothetical protein